MFSSPAASGTAPKSPATPETVRACGWGLDLDLALRARKSGYGLYTTEMAYINHFGRKTANTHFGGHRYHWGASAAMIRGLRRTHGWPAAMGILREMGMAHHRKWHKSFPLTCPASC